ENARENERLANLLDLRRRRQLRRILDLEDLAVVRLDLVDDGRCGRDQREPVLALETLLHDLHMQETQEAAAESEPERGARLGLEAERRVVQRELLQRLAERVVIVRDDR